ncbi:unnamed protein product [Arabidopsis halleri]
MNTKTHAVERNQHDVFILKKPTSLIPKAMTGEAGVYIEKWTARVNHLPGRGRLAINKTSGLG